MPLPCDRIGGHALSSCQQGPCCAIKGLMRARLVVAVAEFFVLSLEVSACPARHRVWEPLEDSGQLTNRPTGALAAHAAHHGAIQRSGTYGNAHNPAQVLIHDNHHPMRFKYQRLESEEIQRPQTVLGVPEKCRPE